MANDDKQVREVANCIRVLLKTDGITATIKEVVKAIGDEDLTNPVALKDKIKNDMRVKQDEVETKPNRRNHIESFMRDNWDTISGNDVVKDVFIKAYCQGRLKKEQREELAADLLARCENQDQPQAEVETTTEVEADPKFDF